MRHFHAPWSSPPVFPLRGSAFSPLFLLGARRMRRRSTTSSSPRSFIKFSERSPAGRPRREINTSGHVHSYAHTGGMEDARMRTSPSRLLLRASVLPRLSETSRPAVLLAPLLLRIPRFIHPQPSLPFPLRFFFAPSGGLARVEGRKARRPVWKQNSNSNRKRSAALLCCLFAVGFWP